MRVPKNGTRIINKAFLDLKSPENCQSVILSLSFSSANPPGRKE